jgi:hypothetical protein
MKETFVLVALAILALATETAMTANAFPKIASQVDVLTANAAPFTELDAAY